MPLLPSSTCILVALLLAASPSENRTELPSPRALLSAMPANTESVLLFDFAALQRRDSLLHDATVEYLDGLSNLSHRQPQWYQSVAKAIFDAKPTTQVIGGSAFTAPPRQRGGVGAGSFVERQIIVVGDSLAPVAKRLAQLAREATITEHAEEKISIYELPLSPPYDSFTFAEDLSDPRTRFVGIHGQHVVVFAATKAEAFEMLRNLETPADLRASWATLLKHVNVGSPIVVLREYDTTNKDDPLSPVNPKLPEQARVPIHSYAFALPSAERLALQHFCRTDASDKAARIYSSLLGVRTEKWTVERLPNGYTAQIPVLTDDRHPPSLLFIQARLLFGQYIAI